MTSTTLAAERPADPGGATTVRRTAPGPPLEMARAARPVRRRVVLAVVWLLVLGLSLGLAAVAVGALVESRAQRALLSELRQDVQSAEAAASSPFGAIQDDSLPGLGEPVALLQVPSLGLQRVVVEGARSGDTQDGPGHVPGTAGLGQPGNSAVVARRSGYGAAFDRLGDVPVGASVVVTTVQGQAVYRVTESRVTGDDVLAPSKDDRITLMTAAGRWPWDWSRARVVTAVLDGKPFEPTPQAARAAVSDGDAGDRSAIPLVVIWGTLLGAAGVASVLLYRRWLVRSTYLLTTPALVALVVLFTDSFTRLLPAWT